MNMPLVRPGLDSLAAIQSYLLPVLLGLGALLAAVGLCLQPPAHGPVAAVFPPWWSKARALATAAEVGAVVGFGAPFVVIVVPQTGNPSAILRQDGAWFVLDPQGLRACGASSEYSGALQ